MHLAISRVLPTCAEWDSNPRQLVSKTSSSSRWDTDALCFTCCTTFTTPELLCPYHPFVITTSWTLFVRQLSPCLCNYGVRRGRVELPNS
jgi:hypothetical protein